MKIFHYVNRYSSMHFFCSKLLENTAVVWESYGLIRLQKKQPSFPQ